MVIIYIVLGILIGGVGIYLGLRPKLKQTIEADARTKKENEQRLAELAATNSALSATNKDLLNTRTVLATEKANVANLHDQVLTATQEIDHLRQEKDRLNAMILAAQEQNTNVRTSIEESLCKDLDRVREDYEQAKLAAEQEYISTIGEYSEQMNTLMDSKEQDLETLNKKIQDAQTIVQAINEEKRRTEAEQSLYMLSVTADDLTEIKALRDVSKTFRDATPVNKLIWSLYYQKPYKTLVTTYLGDEKVCGIYSITDTIDGKRYVGQSVDVANRWSDHIKRGLGADKGTDTKLYAAMKSHGVENFKFELLEKVPRERLNEQEKFWIGFFDTATTGLNTTKGNS